MGSVGAKSEHVGSGQETSGSRGSQFYGELGQKSCKELTVFYCQSIFNEGSNSILKALRSIHCCGTETLNIGYIVLLLSVSEVFHTGSTKLSGLEISGISSEIL